MSDIEDLARKAATLYKFSDSIDSSDPRWRKANDDLWKAMDALCKKLGIR